VHVVSFSITINHHHHHSHRQQQQQEIHLLVCSDINKDFNINHLTKNIHLLLVVKNLILVDNIFFASLFVINLRITG
jgi:hypothetical protein